MRALRVLAKGGQAAKPMIVAKISAPHQSLDRQMAALRSEGCDAIFREKASGRNIKNRPQLELARRRPPTPASR